MYGTDPSSRSLPAVSGQRIPGLQLDVTYFYFVTQTIGSQVVEVEGSFTLGVWNLYSCIVQCMKEFVSQIIPTEEPYN